jgi:lipid-binding SYLF domain-containing protein
MHKWATTTAIVLALASQASAAVSSDEAARLAAAGRAIRDVRDEIPADYWSRAHCVAVVPELKKAAFVLGGEYGKGVMSCRVGSGWSAPVFIQLAKGSWGFQFGAEQIDVVMLVMNDSGVKKMLQNKTNLGADAAVAAGPVGRQAQLSTDAALTAEIVSYSHAQGLFAGIDLSGGVLRPDEDANRRAYGATATPRAILATREMAAPTEASSFLFALGGGIAAATSVPPPVEPYARTAAVPDLAPAQVNPVTDDLRARIAAIQQTIDAMLAEGAAATAPVGTTGSVESAPTPASQRERLLRVRRELEAMLADLNKK